MKSYGGTSSVAVDERAGYRILKRFYSCYYSYYSSCITYRVCVNIPLSKKRRPQTSHQAANTNNKRMKCVDITRLKKAATNFRTSVKREAR